MNIVHIATIAHEANRIYCQSIGDHSQPHWDSAENWQRESAVNGVAFHLANPDAGPEGSHENWLNVKELDGWVYGEVKDPVAKTHPCMVAYKDLPQEQQHKDSIFTGIVKLLTPLLTEFPKEGNKYMTPENETEGSAATETKTEGEQETTDEQAKTAEATEEGAEA